MREPGHVTMRRSSDMRGFEREMSFGVREHIHSSVSDPAASERDAAPYGAVGGRGSLPRVGVFHRHARARQPTGNGRRDQQQRAHVGSGS